MNPTDTGCEENQKITKEPSDVIVVGSGAGGGMSGYVLTQVG